jgi:hypothetical protein
VGALNALRYAAVSLRVGESCGPPRVMAAERAAEYRTRLRDVMRAWRMCQRVASGSQKLSVIMVDGREA